MSQNMRLILVLIGTIIGVLIINLGIIAAFRKKPGQSSRQFQVINRALKSIKSPLSEDTEELKSINELSTIMKSIKSQSNKAEPEE